VVDCLKGFFLSSEKQKSLRSGVRAAALVRTTTLAHKGPGWDGHPADAEFAHEARNRTQPEPFVDAEEAGNFLQLQPRRLLQLARQGKLPAYPIGDGTRKVWRFRLSDLASAMLHSRQRSHVPEEI
jgi:hypothetical protein